MSRKKSATTLALEPIAAKSGLGTKYLRELHREGMPLSSTQAALNWLAQRPDASPAASSVEALRLGRLKLVNYQSEKAALAIAAERNQMIPRDEVTHAFAAVGQAVKSMLLALENNLVPKLQGKAGPEARKITRDELRTALTELQNRESEFWQQRPLGE